MAPIRRYLRITKYSVLECRIYLDNPALAQTWLLNPRNPVLPRVIESVRPLVLPKLREEKERSRKRSTKKKGIKDVVVEDDYEVSIFLTETTTRHSLLTKHKHFHDTTQTKLTSNSGRLLGATNEAPIDVDAAAELGLGSAAAPVTLLREEDSDEGDAAVALADIPAAATLTTTTTTTTTEPAASRRPKRQRAQTGESRYRGAETAVYEIDESDADDDFQDEYDDDEDPGRADAGQDDSDLEMALSGDDAAGRPSRHTGVVSRGGPPPPKRRREAAGAAAAAASAGEAGYVDRDMDGDDKKKMAMDISYEGFSIYGRVLCLVVKRREGAIGAAFSRSSGGSTNKASASNPGGSGGQAMMENWITSTQVPAGEEMP